jgi:hypothetical protein
MKRTLLIIAALMLTACASTELKSSKDAAFNPKSMQHVLVMVAVRRPRNQQMLEDEFVRNLQRRKAEGVASYTLVREGQEMDEAAWKKLVANYHFDTVIVSRLVQMDVEEKEEKHADPKFLMTPSNGMYGYYGYRYVYQPGFSSAPEETAMMETRIFNVADDKTVWSAKSKTDIEYGRDPEAQVRDFVSLIMRKIYK